jgi:hypothetical protein
MPHLSFVLNVALRLASGAEEHTENLVGRCSSCTSLGKNAIVEKHSRVTMPKSSGRPPNWTRSFSGNKNWKPMTAPHGTAKQRTS